MILGKTESPAWPLQPEHSFIFCEEGNAFLNITQTKFMLQGVEPLLAVYVPFHLTRNACPFASFASAARSEMEGANVDSLAELCQILVVRCSLPKLLSETWIDKQPRFVTLTLRHVTR
jgi:hypothetical protein